MDDVDGMHYEGAMHREGDDSIHITIAKCSGISKLAFGFMLAYVLLTFVRKGWCERQSTFQLLDRSPSCIPNSPDSISHPDIVISRATASLPHNSASKLVSGEIRSGSEWLWAMGEERKVATWR